MKISWPVPEPVARRTFASATVLALVSGLSVLRGVLSLDPLIMETTTPWFIWPMIGSALLSLFAFLSRMLEIRNTVRERGARSVSRKQKRAAIMATIPLYIPHTFLLISGVWFQTSGKPRIEQMNSEASYEYKQRLQARQSAREQVSKVRPLEHEGP